MTDTIQRTRRSGFTLLELMIVVVLLAVVMGTLLNVVIRQQRFYRGAADLMETRSQIRQGATILPIELRGISAAYVDSAGGSHSDIVSMSPAQLEFQTTLGSSIVCQLDFGGVQDQVSLPPVILENGSRLTGFVSSVQVGDKAYIYDDGSAVGNADDEWIEMRVDQITVSTVTTTCPSSTKFTTAADDAKGRDRYIVDFNMALPATVVVGAPIRFVRRVRYSLYQAASDSRWYLGYQEAAAGGGLTGIQPVAGPFLAADGIGFTYFNGAGGQITTNNLSDHRAVRRIQLVVRGRTEAPVPGSTGSGTLVVDSLNVSVALRNR